MGSMIPRATLVAFCLCLIFRAICGSEDAQNSDWFRQGQIKYKAGDWREAVRCFSAAIAQNPSNKDAYYFRGDALRQAGKILEGIRDLRTVTEMDPDYSEAWRALGKAYRTLGRFADELVFYEKAIECAKDETIRRDLVKWKSKLRKKLSQAPKTAASRQIHSIIDQARVAQESGHLNKAVEHYNAALKLAPGESSIYVFLGETYLSLGARDKALESAENALILDPTASTLQARCASLLYNAGEKEKAAAEYQKILKEGGEDAEIYLQLGRIRLEQGRDGDAIICWRKAEELTSDPKAKTEVRLMISQLGQTESAVSAATESDPKGSIFKTEPSAEDAGIDESAQQFKTKAAIAEEAQEWDQAIFYYRKAIELDRENPDYHYNLGIIYEIRGDWRTAADAYEEAVRLKFDHVDALVALAEVNAVIFDDRKTALKYYEKAIESAGDPTIRAKIAKRIQMLQGN
jgi:tetratricopeptide (TPR) repeat protein